MSLPSGTVTFLFTDVEGSTRLWEEHPERMRRALARHDALLREAIGRGAGHVFKTVGDAFCAAFATAPDALAAALAGQRQLASGLPADFPIRVRMALHAGSAEQRGGDYFGPALNRVARLVAAGHGGQVLLSQAAHELARDQAPPGAAFRDLGSHRLRDLGRPEQVYQLLHPDLAADFPPLRSLDALPNNLPRQLTSFIGRERDLARVRELLGGTRLLTLTGSGGCGKTRLALQAAADLLGSGDYPDGVWLAELAPLSDPALVPQAAASALAVREEPGRDLAHTLADRLKEKRLLLVLDNCEHLLGACAAFCDSLLRACPGVKVLATSREPLGIAGETAYRVPSLSLPDDPTHLPPSPEALSQYEAVRLFIDRAVAASPGFSVTNATAPAVAQVCHHLDGIPLALELAAARVRAMPVEKIAQRLDDRFHLLASGNRAALPRQQTLRALIDWSYDLLDVREKALLARLSVFAGGWTLEAAEAVCAGGRDPEIGEWEVLDLLTSLADKSLVTYQEPGGGDGAAAAEGSEARYGLLETVRQYARERLAETAGEDPADSPRARHFAYFLALAEEAEPELVAGARESAVLGRMEREHDNFRAALEWATAPHPGDGQHPAGIGDVLLRLAGSLAPFWRAHGHAREGSRWLEGALEQTAVAGPDGGASSPLWRAKAHRGVASLGTLRGDYAATRAHGEASLALCSETGDEEGVAASLGLIAGADMYFGEISSSNALRREALDIYRRSGNRRGAADMLSGLAFNCRDDDEEMCRLASESLALQEEVGNRRGVAYAQWILSKVDRRRGDLPAARARLEGCLATYRELGDPRWIGLTLLNMASCTTPDTPSPRALLEEAKSLFESIGDRGCVGTTLWALGRLDYEDGDLGSARARCEESLAIFDDIREKMENHFPLRILGHVALEVEGDHARARACYHKGLTIAVELGRLDGESLEALARLARWTGENARAARLYGAAAAVLQRQRSQAGAAAAAPGEYTDGAGRHGVEVDAARAALGAEAFAAAWAEGASMGWEAAAAYALESSPP